VAQVLTDLRRLPVLDVVERWLTDLVGQVPDASLAGALAGRGRMLVAAARRCADDPETGAWHFRGVVDGIGILAEATLLAAAGETALAVHLGADVVAGDGSDPENDGLADRVGAVLDAMR